MDAFMNADVDFGPEPAGNLGYSQSVSCSAGGGVATKTVTRTYNLPNGGS
jgi:hypothetical protein